MFECFCLGLVIKLPNAIAAWAILSAALSEIYTVCYRISGNLGIGAQILFAFGDPCMEGLMLRQFKVAALAVAGLLTLAFAPAARADFVDSFFSDLFGPIGPQGRQTLTFKPGAYAPGSIVVSFGDRRLYYIQSKNVAISYPIAIPKNEARWSGVSYVSQKRENPSWTPTADMRRENPKLPSYVAGGDPRNPLGVRALYLGSSLYRIHGTDAPWLIGQQVSHGCIRMYNEDVLDLYRHAKVGAKVIVTWNRFQGTNRF